MCYLPDRLENCENHWVYMSCIKNICLISNNMKLNLYIWEVGNCEWPYNGWLLLHIMSVSPFPHYQIKTKPKQLFDLWILMSSVVVQNLCWSTKWFINKHKLGTGSFSVNPTYDFWLHWWVTTTWCLISCCDN